MDRWHYTWMTGWQFEPYNSAAPPPSSSYRYGKLLEPGDTLFSSATVTHNGAVVARSATSEFVRAPIPDTFCPPLDISTFEGSSSYHTDRFRWIPAGEVNTSRKWRIWHTSGRIALVHACYDGDFVMEVISRPLNRMGSYLRSSPARSFDGVGVVIDAWGRLYIAATGYMEHTVAQPGWQGRYYGRAYLFLVTGTPVPVLLEMVPISDAQLDVRYRVERASTDIRFQYLVGSDWLVTPWVTGGSGRVSIVLDGVQVHAGA